MLIGQPVLEDVGVRVERIAGGVDDLEAERARILADFPIGTADPGRHGRVHLRVELDDVPLIGAVGRAVEFVEEVRVTGIRAVHAGELEAGLEVGIRRIQIVLDVDHRLVHAERIGAVREGLAEIKVVIRAVRIERAADLDMAGEHDAAEDGVDPDRMRRRSGGRRRRCGWRRRLWGRILGPGGAGSTDQSGGGGESDDGSQRHGFLPPHSRKPT